MKVPELLSVWRPLLSGSLKGMTVLDLTHALSGPFGTMLLAELGADVIKVEPPGGDHFRPSNGGATFAVVNRNKRGICLDLKHPDSGVIMRKLIDRADVFVENFTSGTASRLGYGYEAVSALNPAIIYASISGFGQDGPYRDLRGYDAVAQAMSGIMAATGEPDRPPVRVGPSMIDMGTGMYVVIGVLDALRTRDRTGRGAYLDFNLMESAMSWMSQAIARYSQAGVVPPRTGSALATFSPYQVFNGRDGQIFIGASTERFWLRLCDALGLQELPGDPRFVDMKARVTNRAALTEIIEAVLAGIPNDAVLARLRAAGIPCAPVLAVDGVVADPHVAARGTLQETVDPTIGTVLQTRMPIGAGEVPRPAPLLGQHGKEILVELGFSENEVESFITKGAVLKPNTTSA
jgi:crotonobetainyl-CoA:carnitine CoA-transferase CaiB-like acyl-CoA transferase